MRYAHELAGRSLSGPSKGLAFFFQATYVEKVAECLDLIVGMSDPKSAAAKATESQCLSKVSLYLFLDSSPVDINSSFLLRLTNLNQQPDGPAASVRQIIYGYIQQVCLQYIVG